MPFSMPFCLSFCITKNRQDKIKIPDILSLTVFFFGYYKGRKAVSQSIKNTYRLPELTKSVKSHTDRLTKYDNCRIFMPIKPVKYVLNNIPFSGYPLNGIL